MRFLDLLTEKEDLQKVDLDSIFLNFQNNVNNHIKLFENLIEKYLKDMSNELGYKVYEITPKMNMSKNVFSDERKVRFEKTYSARKEIEEYIKILDDNFRKRIGYSVNYSKDGDKDFLILKSVYEREEKDNTIKDASNKFDVVQILILREIDKMVQQLCVKINIILNKKGYKLIPTKIDSFTMKIFNRQFIAKLQKFSRSEESQFKIGRYISKQTNTKHFTFNLSEDNIMYITLKDF